MLTVISVARHRDVTYMKEVIKSYGILLTEDNFEWLINKGDLILSNQTQPIESSTFYRYPGRNNVRAQYEFRVFAYQDSDLPDDWQGGQHGKSLRHFSTV